MWLIGEWMESKYIVSFSDAFYKPISRTITMVSVIRKQIKGNKCEPVIDLEEKNNSPVIDD